MGNCVVTGGAGFIGSNLVERLIKENHNVTVVDIDPEKKQNIQQYIGNKNFKLIIKDINDLKISDLDDEIDVVYHLAASADIRKSFENPTMDLKNNVLGTNAILEIVRKKDIKNLVFASSSAIYGISKVTPTPENVPDIRPISMYGASKLANEAFIHSYSDLYGWKSWMFRFANVVGKNEHRGVIFDFFHKLKNNNKQLEILGDGEQKKSYFDVSDCVHALVDIPRMDKNKQVEIYNLANTEFMSVKELANVVCNELRVNPEFQFTGGDRGWHGDVPVTILSIEKALNVGWKPKYSCEESIERTVRYLVEKEGFNNSSNT